MYDLAKLLGSFMPKYPEEYPTPLRLLLRMLDP
jgi:hypothetical protein